MVWTGVAKVITFISLMIGVPIVGTIAVIVSMTAAASYISLNYQSELKDRPVWRIMHQVYVAVAFIIFMILL